MTSATTVPVLSLFESPAAAPRPARAGGDREVARGSPPPPPQGGDGRIDLFVGPPALPWRQCPGRAGGVGFPPPQDLVGQEVAETRDSALIHQLRLHGRG